MRAINHALTGALLGVSLSAPAAALSLAFVSHFVFDTLPHYDDEQRFPPGSRPFTTFLIADAAACVLLVAIMYITLPGAWFMPGLCAFLATSPDIMWIPRYLRSRATGIDPGPSGFLQELHSEIQWCTTPKGWYLEVPFGLACSALLVILQ